jgi:hypothetical protein
MEDELVLKEIILTISLSKGKLSNSHLRIRGCRKKTTSYADLINF